MTFRFKYSLLTLVIAITLVSMLAAFLVYIQPRDISRHRAPSYVLDMMNATDVYWELDSPPELVASCEINYPPHPDHEYILIMSVKSDRGKRLLTAGRPHTNFAPGKRNTIGRDFAGGFKSDLPEEVLRNATIWAEIRIEDEFGNVLFHDVKESETYGEARAKAQQQNAPAKQ